MIQTEEYNLPSFWASALINDDWTGLTDEDALELNAFIERVQPGPCIDSEYKGFHWIHDASPYVLACDCCAFTFQVLGKGRPTGL